MKQQIASLQSFCTKRCERTHLCQRTAPLIAKGAVLLNPSRAPQCPGAPRCILISCLPFTCVTDASSALYMEFLSLLPLSLWITSAVLSGQEDVFSYTLKHCI